MRPDDEQLVGRRKTEEYPRKRKSHAQRLGEERMAPSQDPEGPAWVKGAPGNELRDRTREGSRARSHRASWPCPG